VLPDAACSQATVGGNEGGQRIDWQAWDSRRRFARRGDGHTWGFEHGGCDAELPATGAEDHSRIATPHRGADVAIDTLNWSSGP
jgi:hypothetical protein